MQSYSILSVYEYSGKFDELRIFGVWVLSVIAHFFYRIKPSLFWQIQIKHGNLT